MKYARLFAIPLLVLAVMALFAAAFAEDKQGSYKLLTTILVPGNLAGGFDISWVDSASETYYLANRTTTPGTGRIDVVDAEHDKYLYSIPGFAGNRGSRGKNGPAGVLTIHKEHELWAGDGDSTAKVVDLDRKVVTDAIPTGGQFRADELAYDPIHHVILIANDIDTPPFVTFISQERHVVLGHIFYPQAVFPDVAGGQPVNHGMEQPVWDQETSKFYISVPATVTIAAGSSSATFGVTTTPPDPVPPVNETQTAPPVLGCQSGSGATATHPPPQVAGLGPGGAAVPVQEPWPPAELKATAGTSVTPATSIITAKARTPTAFIMSSISSRSG